MSESIKTLNDGIVEESKKMVKFEEITGIKGNGTPIAAIVLSGIGDVNDFATSDKRAVYHCIVPKVCQ